MDDQCTRLRQIVEDLVAEVDRICPPSGQRPKAPRKTGRQPNPYARCVGDFIKQSSPKDATERKRLFCIAAKLCSGKASDVEEAQNLCKREHPELF